MKPQYTSKLAVQQNQFWRQKQPADAFSLVELMVVIGIIAILAAVLLPVLGRGKQRAVTTQCLSNLHQIGLGMTIFADENNGLYPESGDIISWGRTDLQTQKSSWMEQLVATTKSTNVYHCPAQQFTQFDYFNGARAAYVVASNFAALDIKRILFSTQYVLSGDTTWPPSVPEDADKDDYAINCVGGDTNGIPSMGWQIHNQGQNILFSDNHVKWYNSYRQGEMTFRYDSIHGWQ